MNLLNLRYKTPHKLYHNLYKYIQICNKLHIPVRIEGGSTAPDFSHKYHPYNTSCYRKNLYAYSLNFDFNTVLIEFFILLRNLPTIPYLLVI